MNLRVMFLTLFYSGYAPKAPGTAGSIVALILGVIILLFLPPSNLFMATILISMIAVKQIDVYEKQTKSHDDKKIVIDELAGMWLALSLAPGKALELTNLINPTLKDGTLIAIVLSFIYFRAFDIKKPSIIGKIDEKVKGGLGVMGDDIVAGLFAALSSAITLKALQEIFLG